MSLFIVVVCNTSHTDIAKIMRTSCMLVYIHIYIYIFIRVNREILLVSHVGGKVSFRFPFVAEASGKCFRCERYRRTTATSNPFSLISSCKFVNKRNRSFSNIKETGIKLTVVIPY